MRLKELTSEMAVRVDEAVEKRVLFFLQSSFYTISGTWRWEMKTEALFCSDVMFSLPDDFEGTKAIFHPDDIAAIKERLTPGATIGHLAFRIITTYGEVRTVVGENITLAKDEMRLEAWQEGMVQALLQEEEKKATHAHLQLLKDIGDTANHFSQSGTWYYNADTHQAWYADTIFRLHGLPPQSLNAHLHTFRSFIHPDDRDVVIEFTDKALHGKTPLHLDYRIVVGGEERWVAYKAQWFYSAKGEAVVGGSYQDITGQKAAEQELEAYKAMANFQRLQASYDEQQVNFGHWQINLLTRKTTYSDHYYRIFGVKPGSLMPVVSSFLNFIHPDDRDMVEAAYKKIIYEHALPEMEYRIIRTDGKTRHILQKAKLLTFEGELIASGIIQDVTVQRMLEKKIASLQEKSLQDAWLLQLGNDVGNLFNWIMNLEENTIEWSESCYRLMGFQKLQPQNITEKSLFSLVHPHDLKTFRRYWEEAVQKKQPAAFPFRLMQRGSVHYMKAVFSHQTLAEKTYFIGTVQDTTGEQVLQQQLSQRVQLAEQLTENIPDRVLITDTNHTILLWNKACELAYGLKKAEAVGQNLFDVFPHLKSEAGMGLLQRVLRGEKVVKEGDFPTPGNGYYNLYLIPLYTELEVTGVLHVVNDVTKEAELRNSLNERLQLIESLLQSSIDRIIALDRNLNYIYWNKRAEEFYGYPKENVVGKNILEVFPQLVNDPSYAEIRRALRGETVHIPVAPEHENYFETYLIPIRNEKDVVTSVLWVTHDATKEWELQSEQRKAQLQLQEEQRRLKEAQAVGHIGSFEWAAASNAIYWSDEMYRIHGLEPQSEEMTLEKVLSFIHPDDAESAREKIVRCRKEPKAITLTHRIKRADGETRFVIRQLQSFADEKGRVTHLSGSLQDITEQKRAEQDVRKNLAILQHAEELAQIGSWEYELATGQFNWSEGMYRLFNLPQGTTVKPEIYLDFAVEEDRSVAKRVIKNLRKDHQVFEESLRISRPDGERLLKVKGSVVKDEHGKAYRMIGIDVDITDIRRAEEKLRASQNLLEQTALASPDAIMIYDLQKKQPLFLNNCLAEWVGTTTEDLLKMGIEGRLQLVHADDRLRLLHFNEKLKAAGDKQVLTLEYRIHAKDGNFRWVRNRSKVFQRNSAGTVIEFLSVLQDITEEKAAESVLKSLNTSLEKKNQELEIANEEITSFAFVASHDLKEPLRKLHTFSNLLLMKEPNLSEEGRQTLEKMNGSVKRLSLLVQDILTLTKVHVDNEGLKPIDLNSVMEQVKTELQGRWPNAVIEAEALPTILGSASQLFYLLKNLVANGLTFQEQNNVPYVNVRVSRGGDFFKIAVRDNGIGIAPEYHKRIFEIFRRLHSPTEYEGTGIGLTICKKIMEKHGGKITVDSTVGKGSTFTCWFPLALST